MIRPKVWKRFDFKEGRGFSLRELKSAGVSVHMAKELGLAVDFRRRSKYEDNIALLVEEKSKASAKKKTSVKKSAPEKKTKEPVKKVKEAPKKGAAKKPESKKKTPAKKTTKTTPKSKKA